MADGRGRGRGRGMKPGGATPMRQPQEETVAKIVQESTQEGRFADAPPSSQSVPQATAEESHNPPVSTSQTTSGILKGRTHSSEVVRDLKAALKEGPKVTNPVGLNPLCEEFTPVPAKLNPSAQPFSPTTPTTRLNPNSAEFSPSNGNLSNFPLPTKYPIAPLNPNSQEFVPKGASSPGRNLNATAPEFIPTIGLPLSMQNGDPDLTEKFEDAGFLPDDEIPTLNAVDIIRGFDKVTRLDQDDVGSDMLLKAAADMLLKATIYPATFERLRLKLETTVKAWPPSVDVLKNLAEMIIHWGVSEPGLRYTASRICQVLVEMTSLDFKGILITRLHVWYMKQKDAGTNTLEEKEQLINCSLFYAEVFARVRVKETPIQVLGTAIIELIANLLKIKDERTIVGACNVLKLTGGLLESGEKAPEMMDKIVKTLQGFSSDTDTLSSHCIELSLQVVGLHEMNWGKSPTLATPIPSHPQLHQYIFGPPAVEGTDSAAFEIPPLQEAVVNPEEWNEFLDEKGLYIGDFDEPSFSYPQEAVDPEAVDPEMQEEFEAFIEEIEEHLMMQEFGPDPEAEEADSAQ